MGLNDKQQQVNNSNQQETRNLVKKAVLTLNVMILIAGILSFWFLGNPNSNFFLIAGWVLIILMHILGWGVLGTLAKYKGRSNAWGLLIFLSLFGYLAGVILLMFGPNNNYKSKGAETPGQAKQEPSFNPVQVAVTTPKFCSSCGAALPEGARFCHSCGTAITQAQTPPQPASPEQPKHIKQVWWKSKIIPGVFLVVALIGCSINLFHPFGLSLSFNGFSRVQNTVVTPPVGPLTSEWEGTWAIDGEDVVSDRIRVEYHYTGKFSFVMSNHPEGWIDIVGSGTAEGTCTETSNGKQSSESFINTYKVNQWYNGTVIVFDDVEPAYFPEHKVDYDYEGTIFESAGFYGDTSVGLHIYTDIKIADIKDGATLIGYGRSRWDSEPNKIVMHLKKVSSSGLTTTTVSAKGDVLTSIYENAEGDQRDNISAIKTELRNVSREELEKALEEIYQYDKEYWISPTNVYRTLLFQVRANRSIQEIQPEEIEGYEFFGRTITKLSILWAENVQASGWADDPEMMSRVIGEMTTKNAILEEGTIISDHYKKLK